MDSQSARPTVEDLDDGDRALGLPVGFSRQQVAGVIGRQMAPAPTYGTRKNDFGSVREAAKVIAQRRQRVVVPERGAAALLVR